MKNYYLLIAFLGFIFFSCSKVQRTVNKMEGKWNVVSADLVGIGEIDPDLIFEFEYCRTRKNDFCEFSIHDFDQDDLYLGSYSINDNGSAIVLSSGFGLGMNFEVYTIEKLNKRKLILTNENAGFGEYRVIELRLVK